MAAQEEPLPLSRKERVATFRVPHSTGEAYRFGKAAAKAGYGRLSEQEFFANDVEVRVLKGKQPSRSELYRAYKSGIEDGRKARVFDL